MGLLRNSKFYNYTLRRNRAFERHGASYHRDYLTDLITNNSITFFRRSKRRRPNQPVLMVLSMPAPHGPEDSAPQHKDMFANITSPRYTLLSFALMLLFSFNYHAIITFHRHQPSQFGLGPIKLFSLIFDYLRGFLNSEVSGYLLFLQY